MRVGVLYFRVTEYAHSLLYSLVCFVVEPQNIAPWFHKEEVAPKARGCGQPGAFFIIRRLPVAFAIQLRALPEQTYTGDLSDLPTTHTHPHPYTFTWKLNEACVIDFMFVKNGRKRSNVPGTRLAIRCCRFASIFMAFNFN